MKVKELKKILDEYEDELDVFVLCSGYGNAVPASRDDIKVSEERVYFDEPFYKVLLIGQE